MRESRTYGSGRGACHEMHVPTATAPRVHHAARRPRGRSRRGRRRTPTNGARRHRAHTRDTYGAHVEIVNQRVHKLGYIEGQNLAVEFIDLNSPINDYGEAMKRADPRRRVHVFIASGTEIALTSAIAALSTLPIVMIAIDYDPLAMGYVASLARPGRNVTGVFFGQDVDEAAPGPEGHASRHSGRGRVLGRGLSRSMEGNARRGHGA